MLLERHFCVISYSKFVGVLVQGMSVLMSETLSYVLHSVFQSETSVKMDLFGETFSSFVWCHRSSVCNVFLKMFG